MASLQQCLYVIFLLLASSLGQETGVVTPPGNGTVTATEVETGIKPAVTNNTVTVTTTEVKPAQEGNISVDFKDVLGAKTHPDLKLPVEKDDPQIAATLHKDSSGLKTSLITEPDSITKDLGGKCSTDKDCLSVNNTYCKDRICVCNSGYIPSKHSLDKCVKVPSGMFDTCEEEAQCNHAVPNSECRDGQCQCPPNNIFKKNRCWDKQMLGGNCNITEQCEDITLAICTQGVCDCEPPFIPSPSNKCLEVAGKEYKAACEEDIQCNLAYGDEARCSHGQCRCTNNYHYNGTACIIDKQLGEPCKSDSQCEVSEINNEEASRICLDNLCACAIGYSSLSGEDICTKTSSGNELAVSLSWILCVSLAKFYFH